MTDKNQQKPELISPEILKFLETTEGKRVFKRICGKNQSRQKRFDRKMSFIDPPKNVVRWLNTRAGLEKEMNNLKKGKKKA